MNSHYHARSLTRENIISTLNEDLIGRNESLYYFLELLNGTNGSSAISLNGYWGSGKTFFVKQAQLAINTMNPFMESSTEEEKICINRCFSRMRKEWSFSDYQPQIAVYYDSWANDNDTDPVLSIVYTIIKAIDENYTLNEASGFLKIAGSIAECVTGRDILKVFDSFQGSNPLATIKEQRELDALIKAFFEDVIHERANRIVVFVDELDRCCPRYAVQLLERIKHYFELENVTFVFSINLEELQHTVRQFYGDGFNAGRYLDRFFDIRISLPPANTQRFYQKIGLENGSWVYEGTCRKVIDMFHFELREISRFYSIAKMAAYKPMHDSRQQFIFPDGRASQYNLLYIVPLMIGLQLSDLSQYEKFIEGKDSSPLKQLILSDEWCQHTLSPFLSRNMTFGEGNDQQQHVEVEDIIQEWYDAVFSQIYDNKVYSHNMGELSFEKEHKQELLRTVSLLSRYASFETT